jgi:hypothetical protein
VSALGIPHDSEVEVSQERIREALYTLADAKMEGREDGTEGSLLAQEYIERQLQGAGATPFFGSSFRQRVDGSACVNVAGSLVGTDSRLGPLVLVAHYDHLGKFGLFVFPGAQDNASSVAILLELCRQMRTPQRSRTIIFLFPGCEEPPEFLTAHMGSEWFVKHYAAEGKDISLAIVLDLLGRVPQDYLDGALFVGGAESSQALARAVAVAGVEPLARPVPVSAALMEAVPFHAPGEEALSDYQAFRSRSIPYLFITRGRSREYHSPEDAPDSCNLTAMTASGRWLLRLVRSVATDGGFNARPVEPRAVDVENDLRVTMDAYHLAEPIFAGLPTRTRSKLLRDGEFLRQVPSRGFGMAHSHTYRRIQLAALRLQCIAWQPEDEACGKF